MKAGWGKAQGENKALKHDLEGMDTDLKRIQAERDRLILSHRDSQKGSQGADLRLLQEQNRQLQEELQRRQQPDAADLQREVQRLGSILHERDLELQECKAEFTVKLAEFSAAFQDLNSHFEALKSSEQVTIALSHSS